MEGQIAIINKESIPKLQFHPIEVISDEKAREERSRKLHLGMILGNAYKTKVRIIFKGLNRINAVDTTIWATTDKNIVLKGGVLLPVSCILQVVI